jgi:hypothetical protein
MGWGLCTIGLHEFLKTGKRGALIVNADYRPDDHPDQPAFDWIDFDDAQNTRDKVLQESIATYDPLVHVLVFVFLLSKSGNSLGIWRRKLAIPPRLKVEYQHDVLRVKESLIGTKYRVKIDLLPETFQKPPPLIPADHEIDSSPPETPRYTPSPPPPKKKKVSFVGRLFSRKRGQSVS